MKRLRDFIPALLLTLLALQVIGQNRKWSGTELPEIHDSDLIIQHKAYTVLYDEPHEQARWVAYMLCRSRCVKVAERENKFKEDPNVPTGSARNSDYAKSGFDRGHLAPAADMSWDPVAMKESFYFSNMSPQRPGFNRGIWKTLEEQVRDWAEIYDTLLIVTGPVLKDGLPAIGASQVSIPEYYYKVILDDDPNHPKGIAFILPNQASDKLLQELVISIDSLENLTGINFFPSLSPEKERGAEAKFCLSCWDWNQRGLLRLENKTEKPFRLRKP